jgi:hypothetical protein
MSSSGSSEAPSVGSHATAQLRSRRCVEELVLVQTDRWFLPNTRMRRLERVG